MPYGLLSAIFCARGAQRGGERVRERAALGGGRAAARRLRLCAARRAFEVGLPICTVTSYVLLTAGTTHRTHTSHVAVHGGAHKGVKRARSQRASVSD